MLIAPDPRADYWKLHDGGALEKLDAWVVAETKPRIG
jgi:hypothetical protein